MGDGGRNTRSAATIEFSGSFQPGVFADFVDHRARRLDLDARLQEIGPERVRVAVTGEPALIDAFEMACSLGPISCLVRQVTRQDGPDEALGRDAPTGALP